MAKQNSKYDEIILSIFKEKYSPNLTHIRFSRDELSKKAIELNISVPKNLGDIIYSYKYRKPLPQEIIDTARIDHYWRLHNIGSAEYEFLLTKGSEFIKPDPMMMTIKIPDATPSIVREYSMSDEQALLAIVRYNRLIDIFLGVSCYSLQNHLRTTVTGIGQIETDEIYVGVDKSGKQYIIPVQAKGGSDKIGITQIEQDIALCAEKFPSLICRSIACQFVTPDVVAIFEFVIVNDVIKKCCERQYKIVNSKDISESDLKQYLSHS